MASWSRRRALQTAIGVSTVCLAGCGLPGGEDDGEDDTGEEDDGEGTEGEDDGEESDARSQVTVAPDE